MKVEYDTYLYDMIKLSLTIQQTVGVQKHEHAAAKYN